jgi:hypothetical protein
LATLVQFPVLLDQLGSITKPPAASRRKSSKASTQASGNARCHPIGD